MFNTKTLATDDAITQIGTVISTDPTSPRVSEGIAQLKQAANDVMTASSIEAEPQIRSAANVVADGLLAAASICSRLQDA